MRKQGSWIVTKYTMGDSQPSKSRVGSVFTDWDAANNTASKLNDALMKRDFNAGEPLISYVVVRVAG